MTAFQAVHVIGATGRSGLAVSHALKRRGVSVIAVVRRPDSVPSGLFDDIRKADLENAASLRASLSDAHRIMSTAHARHIPAILSASAESACLIALGSTRKFTHWPDSHGNGVLAGETALMNSGRPGLLLHPTMIYGAQGENNVQRLVRLLRRLPIIPLPGGGHALVQPIYQDDVTRALVAALDLATSNTLFRPESLVIAGPEAIKYRDFVHAVAQAAGLTRKPLLPVPSAVLEAVTPFTSRLPGFPHIDRAEIRRLMEDKAFSILPMQERLGFTPISLHDGLQRLFDAGAKDSVRAD